MEGDGPTGASVLFQYSGLISVLVETKNTTPHQGLSDMIGGMIKQLREYQTEALYCVPLVMAAILNPRLRLEFFKNKYPDYAGHTEALFRQHFSHYEETNLNSESKSNCEAEPQADRPFDPFDETNVFSSSAKQVLTSDEELEQ